MRKVLASFLVTVMTALCVLPASASVAYSSEAVSSEAKTAAKPRSVILSAYFEDGIVTASPAKKTVKAAPKKTVKKVVKKTPKKPVKKAPVKKTAPKPAAKKATKK
jgi:outer membrane biosynthesis protein TonB